MKDPVRAGSSLVQPRSNSPARTPAVNASHSGAAKTSFGPAVSLESRTAIRSLVSAISTHAPLALLWLLLRQWARDRSGMFIPHPLSSRPRDRSQQGNAFVGPEGGCAEVPESEDIPAYLHASVQEQVTGHAVDVDQALIRWVGELQHDERAGHARVRTGVVGDDLDRHIRQRRRVTHSRELLPHYRGAADYAPGCGLVHDRPQLWRVVGCQ